MQPVGGCGGVGAGGHHLYVDALRQDAVHQSLEGGEALTAVRIENNVDPS